MGVLGMLSFIYFMYSSPLSLFLTPIVAVMLFYIEIIGFTDIILPEALSALCVFNLLTGFTSLAASAAIITEGKSFIWLRFPLYFLLHILASVLAIYQLTTKPHYWDKTIHGISLYKKTCSNIKKK